MELGPMFSMKTYFFLWKTFFSYEKQIYEKIFFLRCEVWDKVVAQKGALPPSKSSIGSKKSAKKKIWKNIFYYFFFIFFYFFLYFFYIIFIIIIIFFF